MAADDFVTPRRGESRGMLRFQRMRPLDTSEEAWARVEEGLRNRTPAERVARSAALTILAHGAALAWIRHRHPQECERQHRLRLAARYIDAETMRLAFGWIDDRS